MVKLDEEDESHTTFALVSSHCVVGVLRLCLCVASLRFWHNARTQERRNAGVLRREGRQGWQSTWMSESLYSLLMWQE